MTNWPTMSGPDGSSAQHASAHHGAGSPRDRTGAAPERPWIGDCDKACDLIRRTAPAGALRSWPRVCRLSSGRGHQGCSVYATRGPGAERGRDGACEPVHPSAGSVFRNSTATSPPWITIHDHVHTMRCARGARAQVRWGIHSERKVLGTARGEAARGTTGAKSGRLSV